jgi:hypothetical protein
MKKSMLMRFIIRYKKSAFSLLVFFVLLMSCTADAKQWGEAKRRNLAEGNESFLSEYPKNEHFQKALDTKANLATNIVFKEIDKSKRITNHGAYLEPTTVVANDGTLLGEFLCPQSSWITGLIVYFYIINKGGSGKVSIEFIYSDDFGTSNGRVEDVNLIKYKEYVVKVSLDFKARGPLQSTVVINSLNKLQITLPNKTKDEFSASIPSYMGSITKIEFIEVK